ncbi:hypothetical protein OAM66_00395 [Pelagibacteraceae bacterium]|jgi:ADP-heptose:LPS heptosyltransferase|nr:hypothetical protein [Pelagibacteraceae bacterium]
MNKYIFFRTDRIGDFLVSSILFKAIKRNDPNSHITIIASEKNYEYIKTLSFVDKVINYPSNILNKLKFFLSIRNNKYYLIGALDGKKRSIYFSLLLKSKFKFLITTKKIYKKIFKNVFTSIIYSLDAENKIDEIKYFLNKINFNLNTNDFNIFDKEVLNTDISDFNCLKKKNFILFHFDEKWIFNSYIKEYTKIEPSINELFNFLKSMIKKTNKNIVVTTGVSTSKIITDLKKNLNKITENLHELTHENKKIFLVIEPTFFSLKYLINKSELLITCHGAPSHVASSLNRYFIDIFEGRLKSFYFRWNSHFKNCHNLHREDFSVLSKNIIKLL